MLLAPSRTKYRRQHRGRMKGTAQRGNALAFGEFGLQALEPCWMEARQIESARIALTRFMKRSGKGAVDHWVAVVKPGPIIFEIGGVSEEVAKEAVRLASHKLPVACRFITRGEAESVEA